MTFSSLFDRYKKRQEKQEIERQGDNNFELTYRYMAKNTGISYQKLHEWHSGTYKPESKKQKNAYSEVQKLAQFFELTEVENAEFFQAAGFEPEDETEESKILCYFGIKALLTKKQNKKLAKLVKQIRDLFPESSQAIKLEIEGGIMDELLTKLVEDLRDISDDPQITLSMKEEKA